MRGSVAVLWISLLLGSLHTTALAADPRPEEPPPIVLAGADDLLGHWQRGEGEAIVEVSQHDGAYRGVIVWSQRRPETVGVAIFRDLRFDAAEGAWHGRAYSIKRKREVAIDIEVPKRDRLELTAHILFFKKRVEFKRVAGATLASLRDNPDL